MTLDDSGSHVVLVVEDEPLIRMMAVDFILDASCEAFEAADADEALSILDAHPEINVLFTDVDLPGFMDGLSLARAVMARRPDLTVLIASGYLKASAVLPKGARFFPEPYLQTEIAAAIKGSAQVDDGSSPI